MHNVNVNILSTTCRRIYVQLYIKLMNMPRQLHLTLALCSISKRNELDLKVCR